MRFSTFVVQGDRAHFYPGMELMYMELIVETGTGPRFGRGRSRNPGRCRIRSRQCRGRYLEIPRHGPGRGQPGIHLCPALFVRHGYR